MESAKQLAEERERRYREAKRAKQENELEKQRALLRFQEDRTSFRGRHQPAAAQAVPSTTPAPQPQRQSTPAQLSPVARAAEARLQKLSTQQAEPYAKAGPVGGTADSAESGPSTGASGVSTSSGVQESSLHIRHVDGRVFEGTFPAATMLKDLRAFVLQSSSDPSSSVERLLTSDLAAQQQGGAGRGIADQVRAREAGRRVAQYRQGGRRTAFMGAPKTLGQSVEEDEEQRAVLEGARRAFQQHTSRIVQEAMQARGAAPLEGLSASDIFFLVPFPRAEFFTEEALSTSLQAAGLCPRGTLAVHLRGREGQQAQAASGSHFVVEEDDSEYDSDEDMAAEDDDEEEHMEDEPSGESEADRERGRALALEAAAKRAQEKAQGGDEEMRDEEGREAEREAAPAVEEGAKAGDGMVVDVPGPSAEKEEMRRRVAEAMARRLGEDVVQAKPSSTKPAQPSPAPPSAKGKEKVEDAPPPAHWNPEMEQRLVRLRAEQAAKAADKERIKRMLEEDREKRKDRLIRQQAGASSNSPPSAAQQAPSRPAPPLGAAVNPALNAAAAAVQRAAEGRREQAASSVPRASTEPAPSTAPPPPQPESIARAGLRIRLEDGSVRTAEFPQDAPMQAVLASVLPEGAHSADYGLLVPAAGPTSPEQGFFDARALGTTIQQAGLAPRGTVHLLPTTSRGVVRQATAPWRRRGPPRLPATFQDEDDEDEPDEEAAVLGGEAWPGLAGWAGGAQLSYEQMLQLQERMGHVRQSVPPAILSALPTRTICRQAGEPGGAPSEACAVCLCEFEDGDEVTSLPCLHVYHTDCISQWLQQSKACPTCKQPVC